MKTLFRSGWFWLTLVIGAIGIGGLFVDLRLKIWLLVIAYAMFIVGPLALYELALKRSLGIGATCAIVTAVFIGIIFATGNYQNNYTKAIGHEVINDIILHQQRESRPPTLSELSKLARRSEPMKFLVPGVRVSYDWESSRGPCLLIYQFPSNWLRLCVEKANDRILKDDL